MEFPIWLEVRLAGRVLHKQLLAQVEREATESGLKRSASPWKKAKPCSVRCRLA